MARYIFRPVAASSGSMVRFDTASGSDTPADIQTLNGTSIEGSTIRAHSSSGSLPAFLGPDGVTTLYAKTLDYRGGVSGGSTTLTGAATVGPYDPSTQSALPLDVAVPPSGVTSGVTDPVIINAAITAVSAAGGGRVRLSGDYYVNASIVVKQYVELDISAARVKQVNGANLEGVVVTAAALTSGAGNNFDGPVSIVGGPGGYIDGNFAGQTAGGGCGILLASGGESGGRRTSVRNVTVKNTRGDGIVLTEYNLDSTQLGTAGTASSAVEPRIVGCTVVNSRGCGIWIRHSSGNFLTDGFCLDNVVGFIQHDGIRIDSNGGWLIDGNHPYAVGLSGILTRFNYATRISNNYVEGVGALDTSASSVGLAAPAYGAGTAYAYGQVVTYGGSTIYISKADSNTGNQPDVSPNSWRPYITGGNAVGGIVCLDSNSGRSTQMHNNQVSLGHSGSYGLQASWQYRAILVQGPSSGSSTHTLHWDHNDVTNEYQGAGSNTTAFRLATSSGAGTGGIRVVGGAQNTARGSWNTFYSADTACSPTASIGAAASGGTGASATLSADSTDEQGTVTIVAGSTGMTTGVLATVNWSHGIARAPSVTLTPGNAAAAGLAASTYVTANTTAASINLGAAPTAGSTYIYHYRKGASS